MDIHQTGAAVDIAASPQRVWEVASDITVMPRFSAELFAVEWADGCSGPALGATFLGRNRNRAIGEWTTVSQIIEFDPPRVFGWAVGPPDNAAATWTFTLRPIALGTRLDYTVQIGPGPSGVTMLIERTPERARQIIDGRLAQLRTAMTTTLEGIRELAENRSD